MKGVEAADARRTVHGGSCGPREERIVIDGSWVKLSLRVPRNRKIWIRFEILSFAISITVF
jgi:hypothetical protein